MASKVKINGRQKLSKMRHISRKVNTSVNAYDVLQCKAGRTFNCDRADFFLA